MIAECLRTDSNILGDS